MGNHHYAIDDFAEAIKIERHYALSHFHMGVSKLKLRDFDEAIKCFQDSDNLEENPAVYDGLGCCYHRKKDYDEAI
jgi:tetratricopeptide (TPR) repeat protein